MEAQEREEKRLVGQLVLHIYASSPLPVSSIVAVRANGPRERTNRVHHPHHPISRPRCGLLASSAQKCRFYRALLEPARLSLLARV